MDDFNHHRAPVLLQSSDDHDHHRLSDHLEPHALRHSQQPHAGLLHPSEEDMVYPGHVYTKDCHDACPDQDIYTETAYIRFDKGMRTNIYGLAVVEELCETTKMDDGTRPFFHKSSGEGEDSTSETVKPGDGHPADPKPQERQQGQEYREVLEERFTSSSDPPSSTLRIKAKNIFTDRIGRYVLVASSGLVTCYIGMQQSLEISIGLNQEIVAINAFESVCEDGCRVVMTIAIARAEESGTQFELLVYGARTFAKTIMDHIASFPSTEDIQRIPISWAPTKISHVPLTMDLSEMAILVGGGDTKVHSFIKDGKGNITELPIEDYFPVLSTFQHSHNCILSMDVRDYPAFRVIAAGTQNGTLNVAIIPRNRATYELQQAEAKTYSVILFSPITSLSVFTSRVRVMNAQGKTAGYMQRDYRRRKEGDATTVEEEGDMGSHDNNDDDEDVHLLMTCAIEQAWVYTAINRNGLSKRSELAACGHHDSILTSYVMDIDWDGENELVIGTYGRQLMVFKQVPNYFVHPSLTTSDAALRYELYWNRRFAYPVYGISSADLNNDGLEELVVTTMYGISFFQADAVAAKRRLARAINKMTEIERLKLRLERLRAENLQLEREAEEQLIRIEATEKADIEADEVAEQAETDKKSKEQEAEEAQSTAKMAEGSHATNADDETEEQGKEEPSTKVKGEEGSKETSPLDEQLEDSVDHSSVNAQSTDNEEGKGRQARKEESTDKTENANTRSQYGNVEKEKQTPDSHIVSREGSVVPTDLSDGLDPKSEIDKDDSRDDSEPRLAPSTTDSRPNDQEQQEDKNKVVKKKKKKKPNVKPGTPHQGK